MDSATQRSMMDVDTAPHPPLQLIEGVEIREIAGRGRGLVASRPFFLGEHLFRTAAFGFADTGRGVNGASHGCSVCLCFGKSQLPIKCAGCPAAYCSEACRILDVNSGHKLCCAALNRVDAVGERKASSACKASASFLLRAFAARRAARRATLCYDAASPSAEPQEKASLMSTAGHRSLPLPTFEDALNQCGDCEGTASCAAREEARERAVALAKLHGGKLIEPRSEALELLRVEANNSYSLRDDVGRSRGWVMYPFASFINHSCVPNVACLSDGREISFEALRDIAAGEEITQCYLMLGSESDDGSTKEWGFECDCPRCTQAVSDVELAEFDAAHICVCGCVTTSSMRQAAMAAGGVCQCHARNRVPFSTVTCLEHGLEVESI